MGVRGGCSRESARIRVLPLIRTRFAALPENEVVAALDAVAETFERAGLSPLAAWRGGRLRVLLPARQRVEGRERLPGTVRLSREPPSSLLPRERD